MDNENHPGFLIGDIQEVHFYDHALSADEISAIYNAGQRWYKRLWRWLRKVFHRMTYRETILSMHPIAYWPLDDPPGGVVRDISGNGHDGHLCDAMSDSGHIDGIIFSSRKD